METSLVLRVCREDFTSYGGFVWPSAVGTVVEAPDWLQNESCGNGLHGWLYGEGDVSCVGHWERPEAKWLVLEVQSNTIISLGGKVKFPRATVVHVGDRLSASEFILANESRAAADRCIGVYSKAGDNQSAVAGSLGTATAGDSGTATAGDRGTATAGDSGTATAGDSGTLCIRWWDVDKQRYRTEVAYVGENGIKPNTKYRLDDSHKFVEVKS